MTGWRRHVADRAERVVEYLGVEDGYRGGAEDALGEDALFIEVSLAWHRAANAESSTYRAEPETDLDSTLLRSHDRLRSAARLRAVEVLRDLDGVELDATAVEEVESE